MCHRNIEISTKWNVKVKYQNYWVQCKILFEDRQPNGGISLNIWNNWVAKYGPPQRNLLASLSDSSRARMSPSLTGPLTFLVICRLLSSINCTLTWVTCPLDPVLPIIFITVAYFTSEFILPLTAKNDNM